MCNDKRIAIIGLGYVGFPLFCSLFKEYECWGIDIDIKHVQSLKIHVNSECQDGLKYNKEGMIEHITTSWSDINNCNFYIIAVPTPVDNNRIPNFSALKDACNSVGKILSKGDIVVFESTVHIGITEELCIPLLERASGMFLNADFYVGYSPERINIGGEGNNWQDIPKIISGSDNFATNAIIEVYQTVLNKPIIKASSIKVAEAAKMYENVQRDVLIALANEYSDYCRSEGVDIYEVTRCASTKWNFATVYPGLVGGHCIGVDPYYLLEHAVRKGLNPSMVKTARAVNEQRASIVAKRIIERASIYEEDTSKLHVLIIGFAYKKNVPDIRNTKVADVIRYIEGAFADVKCYDPLVDYDKVKQEYGIDLISDKEISNMHFDIAVKLVNHEIFDGMQLDVEAFYELKDLI